MALPQDQSCMAARFVTVDYDTPLILPPNLRDWVPAHHLAHFILDAVEEMDLRQVRVNDRGTGSPQYPPGMLLGLLLYCYATGLFSSRRIEEATYDSVPVRMICGDTHPDHDTICTFRRENKELLQETFVRVLELAQARAQIEARAKARAAAEAAQYQAKLAERTTQEEKGQKPRGPQPKEPSPEPKSSDQFNFTDPESRIMKAGSGQHFEQSYNAQAAVEVDSRLIVGQRVSQAPNDKQELAATVAAIVKPVESVAIVLADSGFYSEAAVQKVEQTEQGQPTGTIVYAALEKKEHHRTVSD